MYRTGPRYRVVVEGLLSFDSDTLDEVRDRTAQEIVEHLRKFFPKRARAREDPCAEMVFEFDVAVAPPGQNDFTLRLRSPLMRSHPFDARSAPLGALRGSLQASEAGMSSFRAAQRPSRPR